jgi:hypothetical protein
MVSMKIRAFLDVVPCSLMEIDERFKVFTASIGRVPS